MVMIGTVGYLAITRLRLGIDVAVVANVRPLVGRGVLVLGAIRGLLRVVGTCGGRAASLIEEFREGLGEQVPLLAVGADNARQLC